MKTSEEINELIKSLFDKGEFKTIKPYTVKDPLWAGEASQIVLKELSVVPEYYKLYAGPKGATILQLHTSFRPRSMSYGEKPSESGVDELGTMFNFNKVYRVKKEISGGDTTWILQEDELGKYVLYIIDLKRPVPKPKVKGILVFYINVGNLPVAKTEQYLKRMMDAFNNSDVEYSIPIKSFWFPVKDHDTKVEFISFEAENSKTVEEFMHDAQIKLNEYIETTK
jgi:hypothetical protein